MISKQSWNLLQNEDLKRDTESLLVAAQNQSMRTNLVIESKIDRTQGDSLCSLCKKADENIDLVVSEYSQLEQYISKMGDDNLQCSSFYIGILQSFSTGLTRHKQNMILELDIYYGNF